MGGDLARADHLLDLRRPELAEQECRAVLAETPDRTHALNLLARALHDQDRLSEALGVVDRAVATAPDDEYGHRLRSIILRSLGLRRESLASARVAVAIAPHLWQTHHTLGEVLRHARRTRREALACAREAIRLAPHESAPHVLAGNCYADGLRRRRADKEYREAARLDPACAVAMNNLAAVNANRGRLRTASRLLTSAFSVDPQMEVLRANLDAFLSRLVLRGYLAAILTGIAVAVMAGSHQPYFLRVGVALALIATYVWNCVQVIRALPRGTRLWARGLLRRRPWPQKLLLLGSPVLAALAIWMTFAPDKTALAVGVAILVGMFYGVMLLGIVNIVVGVLRGLGRAVDR